MHTHHPLVTLVGINSLLTLVTTVTPDVLGITYKGLAYELSEKE